jgi:hypothetical protein
MISAVLKVTEARGFAFASRLAELPKWAWWLLALAVIAIKSWFVSGNGLFGNLGDPDDATRLIQVREFLASGHWFDTTTMKIGGDAGMLSHWSRLIDLPLATLIATFSLVMPAENAERLTHIVWPVTLLGAVLWVVYRATATAAGENAGRITLLLAVMCPFALYQFVIGRIDHHNAMIAAMVSAALLIWSHPQRTDIWRSAGILTGVALAVGYEALAPAVAIGIFVTIWGLFDRRAAEPAGAFAVALALTFALVFAVTTAPSRWMDIHCDAISLNMVALVLCGTAGVAVAVGPGRNWHLATRLAVIAATAAVGLAFFGMLEPKCLAGPKGQLPPLLTKVWLDNVAENSSILSDLVSGNLEQSLGLLAFFLIGVAAQARQTWQSRAPADIFLLASSASFTAFAFWQYKYMSYASFLAIVPTAIAISRLGGLGEISANTIRFAAIVLASQSLLLATSSALDRTLGRPKLITEDMRSDADACSKHDAIRDLADLPPGLVAAHIDIGAYIAALTHHRALSAPYHRIANAIIANYQIFAAHDPAEAAAILKRENVDYVIICRGLDAPSASTEVWKDTLRADLVNGAAPKYLTPVPLPNPESIFRVWRVDRGALNLQPSAAAASAP